MRELKNVFHCENLHLPFAAEQFFTRRRVDLPTLEKSNSEKLGRVEIGIEFMFFEFEKIYS